MDSDRKDQRKPVSSAARRDARLKAALKANLGRRKAQARAKAQAEAVPGPEQTAAAAGPDTGGAGTGGSETGNDRQARTDAGDTHDAGVPQGARDTHATGKTGEKP